MAEPIRIVNVERLSDGVLIEFSDGGAALYPLALILHMLADATTIEDAMPNDKSATQS